MYELSKIKDFIYINDLANKTRKREVVYKRHYMMKYLKETSDFTLTKIGKLFNKDHSTVIHALKQYDALKDYSDFREIIEELQIIFPMTKSNNDYISETSCNSLPICLRRLEYQFKNKNNG